MRSACQWLSAALLLTGCGGAPRGSTTSPPAAPASAEAQVGRMTAASARQFLASHPEALILDVRNPDEWDDQYGHIEGARQIPLPQLSERAGEIAAWKEKPILLVCTVGGRSRVAAEMLASQGFRQVINLEGGMVAWRETEPK